MAPEGFTYVAKARKPPLDPKRKPAKTLKELHRRLRIMGGSEDCKGSTLV
jgi:hypothetical protein